jgi:hypothetical protein
MQKGDCMFYEWRYELRCLINDPDFNDHSILLAIRRSLKGTARKIMISLGETATVSDIHERMEDTFGEISTKTMIMQEFFNAKQRPDESVTLFGCRLENLLQTAIECGHLNRGSKNDLLRNKFWTSLYSDQLKSQTRHKYDTILEYNALLREIRKVDKELSLQSTSTSRPKVQANAISSDQSLDDRFLDLEQNLKKEMAKYDAKFDLLAERLDRLQFGPSPSSPQPPECYQGNYNSPHPSGSFQGNYNSPKPSGSFQGNFRYPQPSRGFQGNYRSPNPSYQSNPRPDNRQGRGRGFGRGLPRGAGNGASHYPRSQPKE